MSGLTLFKSQFPDFSTPRGVEQQLSNISFRAQISQRSFQNTTSSLKTIDLHHSIFYFVLQWQEKRSWKEISSPRDETTATLPFAKTINQSNKGYLLLPPWLRNRKPQLLLQFSRRSTLCKSL